MVNGCEYDSRGCGSWKEKSRQVAVLLYHFLQAARTGELLTLEWYGITPKCNTRNRGTLKSIEYMRRALSINSGMWASDGGYVQ